MENPNHIPHQNEQPAKAQNPPPVAIIGMGCLFPKASGLKEYWRLIARGQDAISDVPPTHWSASDYFKEGPQGVLKRPDHVYCTRGGFLSPVDFDPTEFGIPPTTLEATDTSQLLGLMTAKVALEDSGYGEDRGYDHARTSVILGVTGTQELVIPLGARLGHPIWRRALESAGIPPEKRDEIVQKIADSYVSWQESSFPGLLGNVVAGRISNRLNLGGTNCAVDAACASSMSAVHAALMELYTGRADMALTGGVDCLNDIFMHMCFTQTPILSPTGDVRPFSADADGTLLGEGIGILIIKRLADARRDGDRVYAVIRAIGASSDGRSNSIYAPLAKGQLRALRSAYDLAGIDPRTVGLIEAHGTGTSVGDAVEFSALKQLMNAENGGRGCAVGSVKSMIGHTKAAAGAAGLIKAALSLHHKILPPTLKADTPDPKLKLDEGPLYLSTDARPWPAAYGMPRRAGVSAFGFGGSNFHIVLEEAEPEKVDVSWDGSVEILALSAGSKGEVSAALKTLQSDIAEANALEIAEIAFESRARFQPDAAYRVLMVLEKEIDRFADPQKRIEEAFNALESGRAVAPPNLFIGTPEAEAGKIAFIFPGQGSQYVNMGRDLACRFPEFHDIAGEADPMSSYEGRGLTDLIYPIPPLTANQIAAQEARLRRTDAAQPAIGLISIMMARILARFGIAPHATCGHSFGELTALCAAGWLDLKDFLRLAFARGRLMAEAATAGDAGAMTAVKAPLDEVTALIRADCPEVVLANRNSPEQGVISGPTASIEAAETLFKAKDIRFKRLPVAAAFHSPLFEGARRSFAEIVNTARMTISDIPVFANITGTAYPDDLPVAGSLLSNQLVSPVNFVDNIKNLFEDGVRTFIEVGPKSVLTGLVNSILKGLPVRAVAMDASAGNRFGLADLARLLCTLAALGQPVNLTEWEEQPRPRRKPKLRIPLCGANYRSPQKEKAKPDKPKPESGPPTAPEEKTPFAKTENAPSNQNRATTRDNPHPTGSFMATETSNSEKRDRQTATQLHRKRIDTRRESANRTTPNGITREDQLAKRDWSEQHTLSPNAPQSPNFIRSRDIRPMKHHSKNQHPIAPFTRSAAASEAFQAVREGLKSMRMLQAETAKAHRHFLETQAQSSRALQHMMESTERLLGSSNGRRASYQPDPHYLDGMEASVQKPPVRQELSQLSGNRETSVPQTPVEDAPVPDISAAVMPFEVKDASAPSNRTGTEKQQTASAFDRDDRRGNGQRRHQPSHTGDAPHGNNGKSRVESAMISLVSEMTGYPAEMLTLDMDIEADLGIDSIKRVEILSAFEEQMPGMPTVSPEIMGSLKTLRQVVEYLTGNQIAEAGRPTDAEQRSISIGKADNEANTSDLRHHDQSSRSSGDLTRQKIETTLIEIVSELTGYPSDMLSPEMDIEADLGIDSIKRVEILSAMETQLPEIPNVSPEMIGTLKTLRHVMDYLADDLPTPLETSPAETATPPPQDMLDNAASGEPTEIHNTDVQTALMAVVSELTGYPAEMLSPEMDIEADLGIDSIKRVEILSALEERIPGLPTVSPEIMGSLRTIEDVIGFLENNGGEKDEISSTQPIRNLMIEAGAVKKKALTLRRLPFESIARNESPPIGLHLHPDRPVFITRDASGLSGHLVRTFQQMGIRAVALPPTEMLSEGLEMGRMSGLILIADAWTADALDFPLQSFLLAQKAARGLQSTGKEHGAIFGTITRMDGGFGLVGSGFDFPIQGALAGLTKTAALEWPEVRCRAIDIAAEWKDGEKIADRAVSLLLSDGPLEIGLTQAGCSTPVLETMPLSEVTSLDINDGDLFIITGGARGVTSACALALARQARVSLALIGRSPSPFDEPEWLRNVKDPTTMKRAILEHGFDERPTPSDLETAFKRYQSNREIIDSLRQLSALGASVDYFSADIRDKSAVEAIMDRAKEKYGPVKGIIHGAGTLADKRIIDKTAEQFERVFSTKVTGLQNILSFAGDEPAKYLILFSSVAGRMGNVGQSDYAMANETLNKIAQSEALSERVRRVISINWGPWDGGMVTETLRREFHRRGTSLIPITEGAESLISIMAQKTAPVEVVISSEIEIPNTQTENAHFASAQQSFFRGERVITNEVNRHSSVN